MDITFEMMMNGEATVNRSEGFEAAYMEARAADQLDRICFRWTPRQFVNFGPHQIAALLEAHKITEEDIKYSKEYVYCSWVDSETGKPSVKEMTICNFRRYGWCGSPSWDAQYGFGGVIYSNRNPLGPSQQTGEQVVRESLVKAIAELRCPAGLKYNSAVTPLWDRLLDEALANLSRFAYSATHNTNGICGDVTIHK